eukprot:140294-Amphidinium_carterae.1
MYLESGITHIVTRCVNILSRSRELGRSSLSALPGVGIRGRSSFGFPGVGKIECESNMSGEVLLERQGP